MSTRGILGVRVNGVDKLTYNLSDSYPSWLGKNVVELCRELSRQQLWADVKIRAEKLQSVPDTEPTPEEIERYSRFLDTNVSTGSPREWYALLRGTQGSLAKILDSGVYISANDFIADSLFCEFGYIVNLDDMTLELYEGYQREKHSKGRYADLEGNEDFFPCALVAAHPLDAIPENWDANFVRS
jgi:hypothetical protein